MNYMEKAPPHETPLELLHGILKREEERKVSRKESRWTPFMLKWGEKLRLL